MAKTSTQRAIIDLPTTKTSGDLPKGTPKTSSQARGTRGDGSGSTTPPKR
jgi:hypothetical protein